MVGQSDLKPEQKINPLLIYEENEENSKRKWNYNLRFRIDVGKF